MPGTTSTTRHEVGVDSDGISPTPAHRVEMPSSRHSVLAKAARYRSEPERVKILSDEPLVALVHGLHAEHTVADKGNRLVCSCERFRRGEPVCAHVLAVEERRSKSAGNANLVASMHVPLLVVPHASRSDADAAPAPGVHSGSLQSPSSGHSRDIRTPSAPNTDRLDTVS
jgi:hypothetical protein